MATKLSEMMRRLPKTRRKRTSARVQEVRAEIEGLRTLRKASTRTQVEMAKTLDVSQPAIAKIERQSDMYLSTLRSYVEAAGAKPWDVTEHLRTDAAMAAYLDAALEDGDPALIAAALGDVARARGMTEIAKTAGLGRTNLHKALSPDGRPEFATVLKIVRALGLKLTVAA